MESTQVIEILLGLLSFIGAGFIAVVIYVYKMSMKSLDDNSKLIADSNEKNDKAIADLTSKLIDHEASMGKAGKAIHGDMLEIQKEFNKLQTSFSDSIIEVKKEMSMLKIEANELVSNLEISANKFNAEKSRINEMQGKIQDKIQAVEDHIVDKDKK